MEAKIGTLEKIHFNQKPQPESYPVSHVAYDIHESRKTGNFLIKVTYGCGMLESFSEWVCLPDYYEGFAVIKAREWWKDRSEEPFPETVEEFMFLSDSLLAPTSVMVILEGKFQRVTGCRFGEGKSVIDPYELLQPFEVTKAYTDSFSEVPF